WVLDQDGVTRIERQSRRQVQPVLNTRNNDHLVGITPYAARRSEVMRDGFSQGTIASRVAISQQRQCRAPHPARNDLGPQTDREFVERRLQRPERPNRLGGQSRNGIQTQRVLRKPYLF